MEPVLSSRQIDQLLAWGGKFLRAASTKPDIMQLMMGLGYSEGEHKTGWELYLKMLGYRGAGAAPVPVAMSTTEQLRALNQIDHFDEPAFRRAGAALGRLHPSQCAYLFAGGLSAKTGPESVGSVQTFLDRYASMRDGTDPNRADTRDADRAAAKTLEDRNIINPQLESELRQLIEVIKKPAPLPAPVQITATEEALQNAAAAFAGWLTDWRGTASAGIHRRDYRIILGISRRRAAVAPEDEETAPATNVTVPTTAAHA
ncbi:MAG TPA: hypothetical protein VIV60_04150 [Polyangiaceae bacterium]